MFAALTRIASEESFKSLSPIYLQKIELCNNGIYNDLSDLQISPQYSSTDNNGLSNRCLSDNETILDKTTHSKIDDHSFALSKQDMSEYSHVSKQTTISNSLFSKQRLRPPALQITKKQINPEPKSANLKDQEGKSMRRTATLIRTQSKSNNTTEEN